jgi:hypothetical protein
MTDEQFAQIVQYLSNIDYHGYISIQQFISFYDFATFVLGVLLGIAFGRGVLTWGI